MAGTLMTPTQLKDRFRRDVDDFPPDPQETAGCLWSDDDIFDYMNEVQKDFVARTLYLFEVLEIPFSAGETQISLPSPVLEVRGPVYLKDDGTILTDVNVRESVWTSDYGVMVPAGPTGLPATTGRPSLYSLDIERGTITIAPEPLNADTIILPAYLEAPDIDVGDDAITVTNLRYQMIILDGMKAVAYRKQDADAYDPNQADRWQLEYERKLQQAHGESLRRRRNPGEIVYGGI